MVDLPEPVGPVTSTKPRGLRVNSATGAGSPSSSRLWISSGIRRKAALTDAALEEDVDAEAGDARDRVGEVELALVLEALALRVVEHRVDDLPRVLRGHLREVVQRRDRARSRASPGGSPGVMCTSEARTSTIWPSTAAKSTLTPAQSSSEAESLSACNAGGGQDSRGRARRWPRSRLASETAPPMESHALAHLPPIPVSQRELLGLIMGCAVRESATFHQAEFAVAAAGGGPDSSRAAAGTTSSPRIATGSAPPPTTPVTPSPRRAAGACCAPTGADARRYDETRATSAIEVTPAADLGQAVLAQGQHALLARDGR